MRNPLARGQQPVRPVPTQGQHGDVLLYRISALPEGAESVGVGQAIVLAEGEVTGHRHVAMLDARVEVPDELDRELAALPELELHKSGDNYFLTIPDGQTATLTHEEHGRQTYEAGTWQVARVREKDWLSGMTRRVMD